MLLAYYLLFGITFGGYVAAAYTNATFERFFREPDKAGERGGIPGDRGDAGDPEERI